MKFKRVFVAFKGEHTWIKKTMTLGMMKASNIFGVYIYARA